MLLYRDKRRRAIVPYDIFSLVFLTGVFDVRQRQTVYDSYVGLAKTLPYYFYSIVDRITLVVSFGTIYVYLFKCVTFFMYIKNLYSSMELARIFGF